MKIITSNPVIFNGKCESYADLYIPLDGKSSKTEIQAFQDWLDVTYPTWLNGGTLNKKGGYGNFGSNTSKAWATYGSIYTALPKGEKKVEEKKAEEKKKGEKIKEAFKQAKESGLLDKALGLFGLGAKPTEEGVVVSDKAKQDEKSGKGVKIALIVGGVALVGAIIYFVAKKK